ncbi:SusC/RagA family TonB-linked outer membrane protein [Flammeovirga pectinis]|uniref:SusC/RagA family TonB-linked outer membrane protein n=1 Tax=Flammeovirga pectinis TaxID=2494373 RepID=A0A3Q9FRK4_9BACT|nr:SusC/RagA family TonB-linked outer membrane protein [Flammeovirga pectinis]AZQ64345.1 SusC/RagA family TonB-linked outer membrane protein [Flammeovirga pectinis]
MKKALLLLTLFLSATLLSVAQERTISGVIKDSNGESLPGVAIIVKGTSKGTVSNIEGQYKLLVPNDNTVLVFRLVGFKEIEKAVGSQTTLSISLDEDAKQLDEVVVSALGFEEDIDKLGSAPSKISSESLVESGEANLINGMAGKASGVRITRSSGDPGAGSSIQIRGQSTITGNLQPLIIVDGMPINNSNIGEGTDGVTQQSRMNDINPNDIESMQVLKGASAAALWGSRAANGVIVITTKKGSSAGKKLNVSFRTSYSMDKVNKQPNLQSTYGQGFGGAFGENTGFSWGDKISERAGGADAVDKTGGKFTSQSGKEYYTITQKNSRETYEDSNWDEVFQTGSYWENNLSLSGGDRDGSFMFSISDLDQNGVVKNSNYKRTTARLNTMKRFGDKFKLTNTLNYTHTTSDRTQKGSNLAGLMLGLLRTSPDFDNRDYKGTYDPQDGSAPIANRHRSYRSAIANYPEGGAPTYNNPSWTVNEQKNPSKVNRFVGTVEAQLLPATWFDVTLRTGIDYYNEQRSSYFPQYSSGNAAGYYDEDVLTEMQFNTDLIGRVQKEITSDLHFTGLVGFNYNQRDYSSQGASMTGFVLATAPPNFTNATAENTAPYNYYSTTKIAAMYGSANFAYKNKLFVNGTLRGEAASTYGENAESVYYYPSADAAYQLVNNASGALSFAKLRTSWGQVGVQPGVYRTKTLYVAGNVAESWGPELDMSGYGGGFSLSSSAGNSFLKPEIKSEWEVGADFRFLADKMRLGVTYFQNETQDVLFDLDVAPSAGFSSQYGNAGTLENKGIELDLGYDIFRSSDWRVSLDLNWTKIDNKVTDLQGAESIFLEGFTSTSSRAVEGYPVGSFWGTDFERNEDGSLVLDDAGFPMQSATESVIGNPNPEWNAGLGVTVQYKGFRLYALFDHQQGGQVWNGTKGALSYFGRTAESATEATATTPVANVYGDVYGAGETFRGAVHDFGGGPVALDETWYWGGLGSGFTGPGSQFIEDATSTRLRELTMSYSLSMPQLKKALKVSSIDLSITGRNLFIWTDYSGIDPETNLTGASNGRGLDYFNNPSTKSWVFTAAFNW